MKKPGPMGVSFKWGVIGGIVVILVSYMASFNINWSDINEVQAARNNWTQWLSYGILALIIVMAQIEHRKRELGG
ncbi:MAG: hypothetical protein LPK49_10175, partial [Bacteroidota bacterium]|nr:hypothetical protein [Bacteroidota bacterium]MDX5431393.1 hypothetical protein [Bacteroidota bacterium]